jgi:D-lyxose ketol-isomerase
MKRSEINNYINHAQEFFRQYNFNLPIWAKWDFATWENNKIAAQYMYSHQMGWDVTDFASNNFQQRGLLLFCIRNGIQKNYNEKPYAEKIMIVKENQETPFHFHKFKMEDIIVRAGGNLLFECYNVNAKGEELDSMVEVLIDGMIKQVKPRDPIRLTPGQSITVVKNLMHRFYGEEGHGPVLVGEVSQVNDDKTDNYFAVALGRFANIEEDCAKNLLLWTDLKELL